MKEKALQALLKFAEKLKSLSWSFLQDSSLNPSDKDIITALHQHAKLILTKSSTKLAIEEDLKALFKMALNVLYTNKKIDIFYNSYSKNFLLHTERELYMEPSIFLDGLDNLHLAVMEYTPIRKVAWQTLRRYLHDLPLFRKAEEEIQDKKTSVLLDALMDICPNDRNDNDNDQEILSAIKDRLFHRSKNSNDNDSATSLNELAKEQESDKFILYFLPIHQKYLKKPNQLSDDAFFKLNNILKETKEIVNRQISSENRFFGSHPFSWLKSKLESLKISGNLLEPEVAAPSSADIASTKPPELIIPAPGVPSGSVDDAEATSQKQEQEVEQKEEVKFEDDQKDALIKFHCIMIRILFRLNKKITYPDFSDKDLEKFDDIKKELLTLTPLRECILEAYKGYIEDYEKKPSLRARFMGPDSTKKRVMEAIFKGLVDISVSDDEFLTQIFDGFSVDVAVTDEEYAKLVLSAETKRRLQEMSDLEHKHKFINNFLIVYDFYDFHRSERDVSPLKP